MTGFDPDKTYVIICKTHNDNNFAGEDVSVYSTDQISPDQWAELAAYAEANPSKKFVILEGEQLDLSEKTLSLFLPLVELRNVYMPKSLIDSIRQHFRTIEYHEYLSAYGQMRVLVDLIKDYETQHPITNLFELDMALNLIGGGWGKRNLFTRQIIDKVADSKTIFRIEDERFDIEAFCETVLDEQTMATNTYETIMLRHTIHKLIYIIQLLMRVKTYIDPTEMRQDLLSVIKRIHDINDERNLGGEDPSFFEKAIEFLDSNYALVTDGNLGGTLEKKAFNEWVENLPSIEELWKIYEEESRSSCFGSEAHLSMWKTYNVSMLGYLVRLINESEITFCNALDYGWGGWYDTLKELYDWTLIKDIIANNKEYAKLFFTESMSREFFNKLNFAIEDDDDLLDVGVGLYFPKTNDQFPLFYENFGEITMLSKEKKDALLSVLRSEYQES